ncbi:MAG: hypothetical protein KBS62_06595 [Oscillospiraceae bacterium]|nr:hypothetical protein [Candidatus Ruminococcus equi]
MTKSELKQRSDKNFNDVKSALQLIFDNLNKGQQQKLLKNEKVKALLERYEVEI